MKLYGAEIRKVQHSHAMHVLNKGLATRQFGEAKKGIYACGLMEFQPYRYVTFLAVYMTLAQFVA